MIFTKLYEKNHGVTPDDYDRGMVDTFLQEWNSHFRNDPAIPRVGDFLVMPDGTHTRVAHVLDNGVQPSDGNGSFALDNGYVSMSGGLDSPIPFEKVVPLDEEKAGDFWVFHHNHWAAHNSIGVSARCRVFRVTSCAD